jgi:para-nitrobenzyl esterase
LNEASKKAIAKVQDQMKKDGKAFVGGGLGWGPVHDGDFLPYQQVDPAGLAISKIFHLCWVVPKMNLWRRC